MKKSPLMNASIIIVSNIMIVGIEFVTSFGHLNCKYIKILYSTN
jgi:hypothetical protein